MHFLARFLQVVVHQNRQISGMPRVICSQNVYGFHGQNLFFYSSFLLSYINSVATKLHSFGITLKKMKLHAFVSIIHRPSGGRSTFEAKLIFRGIDMGRINPRI